MGCSSGSHAMVVRPSTHPPSHSIETNQRREWACQTVPLGADQTELMPLLSAFAKGLEPSNDGQIIELELFSELKQRQITLFKVAGRTNPNEIFSARFAAVRYRNDVVKMKLKNHRLAIGTMLSSSKLRPKAFHRFSVFAV